MRYVVSLRERASVAALVRRGREFRGELLILRVHPGQGPAHRVVIVTPKKLFRRAVDRNRVARRCRALLQTCLSPPPPAFDVAVLPRVGTLRAPYTALSTELGALLSRCSA